MAFSHEYFLFNLLCFLIIIPLLAQAKLKHYQFDIAAKNVSRLRHTKPIITVNGMFPGPTIYVEEGDSLFINVTNYAQHNMSIHWHGLKQLRNGWADGPAYITQCPIKSGESYVYRFDVIGQRGTLWWHSHVEWLRATVYGAFVITPKHGDSFPFPKPHGDITLLLGEWWNTDIEEMVKQQGMLGLPPKIPDAYTINGMPGPRNSCSGKGMIYSPSFELAGETFLTEVEQGKTYLIRVVNAALNTDLFFSVTAHNLTVVELDAVYCKPFSTGTLVISPGQTTTALLTAEQLPGRYSIVASPFINNQNGDINTTPSTAILKYKNHSHTPITVTCTSDLAALNHTLFVASYTDKLHSLNSPDFPTNVPLVIDRKLFYTIGLGLNSCPTCPDQTQTQTRFTASLNNITFVMPKIGLLQAHYLGIQGVFRDDFPDNPANPYNYTDVLSNMNLESTTGTRVSRIQFNSTVELVLQNTNLLTVESHPFHLHGYNFFVVGSGMGNFDSVIDPVRFNLVDPPERNTVRVPAGGWTAIRFRANNPGVWFMHCHLEPHASSGLEMAFLVENGDGPEESILPPQHDLPPC